MSQVGMLLVFPCSAGHVKGDGGHAPIDGYDPSDPVQHAFLAEFGPKGPDTLSPEQIDASRYDAVFFVGGHGTMWDFANNRTLAAAPETVAAAGGVIAAVCHGPSGLVGLQNSDGSPIVSGKRIAAFTNDEETAVGLTDVVPFLLADALIELGAIHIAAPNFTTNVVVDGQLITGQNPASAEGVARAIIAKLS